MQVYEPSVSPDAAESKAATGTPSSLRKLSSFPSMSDVYCR